ncbi:LamG-like jellyroll fold domain-containing protein [Spirosoma endbachense]|uniref:LamG-like jellyroll fold domain-containing protein n=1 Tax=Spirosoma endbachense TaxID=2666025 RepID=UPI00139201D9|nr:LamG-like jellyroll fold domain-containing protein [Spirosoma endbachense]
MGGVSATNDRLGNPSQAYNFDGSAGCIVVSNWGILTGNAARTISVWFKTTIPASPQYMVSWGFLGTNQSNNIGTYTDGNNSTRSLGFFATDVNTLAVTDAVQYYDGRWHLLTFTHDGSTLKLYLDGTVQKTATNVTLNTASSGLAIGRFATGPYYFAGSLDEVRIYNRALTDTEVQQMYTAEAPVPPLAEFAKIGSNRFIHTIGQFNTSVGNMAGNTLSNSSGTNNTFTGYQTGRDNSTGSFNTLMGYRTGFANTTGSQNTLVGSEAGNQLTSSSNTMFGYQAGKSTTTGQNNTFVGVKAGINNTTGSNNIIIGPFSGTLITDGSDNVLIGYNSQSENGLHNATAIGTNSRVAISNAIILGNKANVGIGTSTPTARLHVRSEQAGESGVRFEQLTSQSPVTQTADQFLTVNEKGDVIKARYQLRISSASDWSDKVFAPTYQLRPLSSVDTYIKQYQHLPGIPSAKQVAKEGIDLVKMNTSLLEKVEELTLYSIQLEKELTSTKQQRQQDLQKLQALEQKQAELEGLLNQLLNRK